MTAVYGLPDRLEGAGLAAARDAILRFRGQDLDLDGAGVTRMNGLGLQLLLAAFRTWGEDGRRLRLTDPSAPVLDVFTRLNLDTAVNGDAA